MDLSRDVRLERKRGLTLQILLPNCYVPAAKCIDCKFMSRVRSGASDKTRDRMTEPGMTEPGMTKSCNIETTNIKSRSTKSWSTEPGMTECWSSEFPLKKHIRHWVHLSVRRCLQKSGPHTIYGPCFRNIALP